MMKHLQYLALFGAFVSACAPTVDAPDANQSDTAENVQKSLTIYSSRHYDSDRVLYDTFEQETGIRVDVRESGASQLLETMKAEGASSPADLIIAADAGALWRFQDAGLLQPVSNAEIEAQVPSNLREKDGHWFGVGRRVRLVAYDPTRFEEGDVDSWMDLISEDKRGEICVRSSSNIYNLSLLAELIDREGEEAASNWASGIVANMARNPQGGDSDQIRAVGAGQCGIAITNHYYWVRLANSDSDSDREAASKTRIVIPSFSDDGGAHTNVTGIGVTATADDVSLATEFINFLLTKSGQEMLTVETKELPITADADLPSGVEAIPQLNAAATPLDILGENQAAAQRIYDLAGWN